MTHFWPTSVEAVNTAQAIALVGGTALMLLLICYALDWWQDKRDARARIDAFEHAQSDMAQRRAQATRGRGR